MVFDHSNLSRKQYKNFEYFRFWSKIQAFVQNNLEIKSNMESTEDRPRVQNSYLWTYDLYGPVRNAFDAGQIHYDGNWEGVGPWKSRHFWAL
jgi:hypothetical protein